MDDKFEAQIENELAIDLFFNGKEKALALYKAIEGYLLYHYPDITIKVQRTQISFYSKYLFACVSFLRVKEKAYMPDPYVILTLGLPYPVDEKDCVSLAPYPGSYTCHFIIGDTDIDRLATYIDEAYRFSKDK